MIFRFRKFLSHEREDCFDVTENFSLDFVFFAGNSLRLCVSAVILR